MLDKQKKYANIEGVKYLGKCICVNEIIDKNYNNGNDIHLNKVYDYYLEEGYTTYWVVYDYEGKSDKQGFRFNNIDAKSGNLQPFNKYFSTDVRLFRGMKLKELNKK
jgi:hypothetical protein